MTVSAVRSRRLRVESREWSGVGLPVAVFAVGVASLGVLASGNADAVDLDVVRLGAWLSWPVVAAVLLDQRPREPLGLVMSLVGLAPVVLLLGAGLGGGERPTVATAAQDAPHLIAPGLALVLVAVPLAFPTGWPADRWGRLIGSSAAVCVLAGTAAAALRAGSRAVGTDALTWVDRLGLAAIVPLGIGALVRQVLLHRRSVGAERHRTAWFLWGVAAAALGALAVVVLDSAVGPAAATYAAAALLIVVAVGLAVLALAVSPPPPARTGLRLGLGLGFMTALGITYAVSTVLLRNSSLPDPRAGAVTLTTLVGLALVPGYLSVRDSVLGRRYGTVHRPRSAMALVGRSAQGGEVADALAAAADAVAAAVSSPGAEVHLGATDRATDPDAAVLPLVAGDAHLGTLVVEPRRPGEAFTRADRELLDVLVTPVAQLARAAVLARELELARGDAVAQRLDERRRLRRDLHDRLGPLLSGLGLQAEAVRRTAPPELEPALARVSDALRECRREVRALVDGLEPDEATVGDLETAVRELVAGWASAAADTGLVYDVIVPAALPPLDPPVRQAAYRIIGEALTNVVRHADAGLCRVTLQQEGGQLVVEVSDDGRGLHPHSAAGRAGFGVQSMDERARAVRGHLSVDAVEEDGRGTVVRARLPVSS